MIRVLYPVFQQYLVYLEEEMKMKSNNQVRINLPFYLSTCLPGVLSEICLGWGAQHQLGPENPLRSIDFFGPGG